jgi:hypothetical protein
LSYWFLTGFNTAVARDPAQSRYQYIGVFLALLVAGELLRGVRLRGRALIACFAVALAAVASSVAFLHQRWEGFAEMSREARAAVTAIEIARDSVDPEFAPADAQAQAGFFGTVVAGPYLAAADDYGSPAYDIEELPGLPANQRASVDRTVAAALGLALAPASAPPEGAACRALTLAEGAPASAELPAGGVSLLAERGGRAAVGLRRYTTDGAPVELGTIAPGEAADLAVPADRSEQPWTLVLAGTGSVRVCDLG